MKISEKEYNKIFIKIIIEKVISIEYCNFYLGINNIYEIFIEKHINIYSMIYNIRYYSIIFLNPYYFNYPYNKYNKINIILVYNDAYYYYFFLFLNHFIHF